jgi:anaphase-promoting complex subunit 1
VLSHVAKRSSTPGAEAKIFSTQHIQGHNTELTGLSLGQVGGKVTEAASRDGIDRGPLLSAPHHEHSKCSRISEGEYINTGVTAAGATLALALMFIRSNNTSVAARLSLPDTHFLLDYVRPDLLLLRVVARALILWDSVEPTEAWVRDQIPKFIRVAYDGLGKDPGEGSRFIDKQSIRQSHANIIAGGCLALGLRFASTAEEGAVTTIMACLHHFRRLREQDRDPLVLAQRPERPILEMCLATTAIALGLVMAGTGDLACFRLLRELRWRVDGEISYGNHMALHMAIGLLFLGGGRAALSRSNEAIAALLAALYPRFPAHTADNQYSLQALRHLYVLAVEQRGVEAVDVETREAVYMPLEVDLRDGGTLPVVAPCLLPELDAVAAVRTASQRYYPITFDLAGTPGRRRFFEGPSRRILVKRKPGHLSYAQVLSFAATDAQLLYAAPSHLVCTNSGCRQ